MTASPRAPGSRTARPPVSRWFPLALDGAIARPLSRARPTTDLRSTQIPVDGSLCAARGCEERGSGDLREDAKRRLADREFEELGIPAAELVRPALVAALDLDLAHRQRLPFRLHGAEADA